MADSPDHDLLIELRVKLDDILRRFNSFVESQSDHEQRIRKLEGQWMKIAGVALAAGAASDIVLRIITKH